MNITQNKLISLSQQYGNAFYLLDSEQFEKNFLNLTKAFSSIYPHFNVAYSYKTNYIPKLCGIVNRHGGYAEVVSDMEMELALRIGVLPEKIIWNGPVKKFDKVRQLLVTGGTVNIDSVDEIKVIQKIAQSYPKHRINVGLRCNFDIGDGVISRFGLNVESEEFGEVISFVKNSPNVHLVNLQCHFAKRNIDYWPARAEAMVRVADKVEKEIGYIPDRIDLGGGLYGNMDESLKKQFNTKIPEYIDYAEATATIIIKRFPDAGPELLIEPGSALAGDSMKFVASVQGIKKIKNKYFAAILGSQKNISMGGVNPPLKIFSAGSGSKEYCDIDIVGYTCIEGDIMYKNYSGELAVGDYLVFSNCGSYSIVMKPPFIMPNFAVLDICGEKTEVIKRQETFDDLFHTYSFDVE